MRKTSMFLTFLLILTVALPAFASTSTKTSTINLTVVLKNQSVSKSFKDLVVKSGGKIEREIPQLGAIEIRGSADLITVLQKNTEVSSVSPSIKMSLPTEKKVAFTAPSTTQVDQQKRLGGLIKKYQTVLPYQAKSLMVSPTISKPPGDHGGEPEVDPDLYNFYQWDIKKVTNYGASFKNNSGTHNVVVGIIDTGVDYLHPDLQTNYMGGRNYVPAGANGDSTETGDPTDVMDRNGHGSHVAGSIAGKGRILGVAPGIGYRSYRVFGAEGGAETSTVAQAIIGATNDGVDVISMSLGGYAVIGATIWTDPATGKHYNLGSDVADFLLYKRAVKYATDHGVTVVAAAGNDGINITNKKTVTEFLNEEYGQDGYTFIGAGFEQPGLDPGVITVSATGPMDTRASYSNYGPGSIDITAPGGDGQRYDKGLWYLDLCLGAYKDNGYIFMAGTSMATPKVSAVAALLISKYGKMAPQKVARLIRESAEDIGDQGKDQYFGNGMVQAPSEKEQLPAEVDWHKQFGGALMERGSKVHQTADGGYIMVGASETFSTKGIFYNEEKHWWDQDVDMLVVKVGKDGRTEWYRPLGSESLDEWGNDVVQTKDGGYLVVGYSGKYDSKATDVYLVKLSSTGETQWENTIGQKDLYEGGIKLLPTADGGYVMAGSGYDQKGVANDVLLMKIDSNGKEQWTQKYGGAASDTGYNVVATRDGGYIVAGQSYSVQMGRGSDFYLIKTDSKGTKQWEKTFGKGDFRDDFLYDVVENADGDYILVGDSSRFEWVGGFFPEIFSQSYFAKVSKKGDLIWENYYGDDSSSQSAQGLVKTSDGNYIAAGYKNSSENSYDVALWKFDDKGNQIWAKQYGGNSVDIGSSIEATKDGGYAVLGYTGSYTSGDIDDRDMYLLKLNSAVNK
ncbi:S8 family serine peptidase [Neobacillus sp. PS3-34]|uniref:S8 family peptidase n=1 Tax=Neobacillus sp. PS3-34 TaxID=3070678 RepID=UPI0027DFDE18|nr:S8 family serine peptidase [Neobacillus sp. PS3-34]WML48566.1 S8 family serine peptidase [Neobacillus sp. PS3-34]